MISWKTTTLTAETILIIDNSSNKTTLKESHRDSLMAMAIHKIAIHQQSKSYF